MFLKHFKHYLNLDLFNEGVDNVGVVDLAVILLSNKNIYRYAEYTPLADELRKRQALKRDKIEGSDVPMDEVYLGQIDLLEKTLAEQAKRIQELHIEQAEVQESKLKKGRVRK